MILEAHYYSYNLNKKISLVKLLVQKNFHLKIFKE